MCAKNSLQNVNGYSPNQLVFGANISLPSVVTDQPPALEPTTQSEIIRKKLSVIHNARKNFIKSESSEKIRRALNHQVRTFSEEVYIPGEKVYYKRRKVKGWKGPAKVLGKEGNFVLIRHGSAYYQGSKINRPDVPGPADFDVGTAKILTAVPTGTVYR